MDFKSLNKIDVERAGVSSPEEVEYVAAILDEFNTGEPGSNYTDSPTYRELRDSNEE